MTVPASADVVDLVGRPWVPRDEDPVGFSCYALVREVCRRAGREAPRLEIQRPYGPDAAARLLADLAAAWEPIPAPEPLALVSLPAPWCDDGGHCGILLADRHVLHSVMDVGVICQPLGRLKHAVRGYYRLRERAA